MFTGIVQGMAHVVELERKENLLTLQITFPEGALNNISVGASIAIEGVCLTVTDFDISREVASFDVIKQTCDLTTLSQIEINSPLNFERSAQMTDEVGGHIVSGHIDTTAQIVDIVRLENTCNMWFEFPEEFSKYIMDKGFISLSGCSLTIADVDKEQNRFMVSFIPETLQSTTHGLRREGDYVNMEIERQTQAIVDTVERFLANR